MVPVHRKQRVLCLCSWLPAGVALTGSLAATITSCVAQGTGIRPPPRGENRNLKKNHRNNARGREVQAGWEGQVTSHTQTPRLCWGRQSPSDPAWNSSPSSAFRACSTWRDDGQRSPPCQSCWIHHPGTAGTSILLLSPEQLCLGAAPARPRGEGAEEGPQQPCPGSQSGTGAGMRRVGIHGARPGSVGTPSPFPAGLRCSSHARSRQQEIQTTLIF